jgi:hypothetical protein
MSAALELIQVVEAAGGRFKVDGDQIKIFPKGVADPLLEELRQHKQEIIELLSQRPKVPPGIKLICWEPKVAPVKISRRSMVTNVEGFVRTTLAQLDAQLRGWTWLAGSWGVQGLIDRLAAVGCVVEIDDPGRALE